MVDDLGRHAALDAGQIREKLRTARRPRPDCRRPASSGWGSLPTAEFDGAGRARRRRRRGAEDAGDGRRDRRAHQRVQRVHAVLRRLHGHEVADAVVPVQPLVGRHLAAGAQRNQQAVGDVALLQAHLAGLAAVHVDAQFGIIDHLVDVHVGGARNVRDALGQLPGRSGNCRGSRPTTCRSMGAGRPKFRIWLVMLAASKKNVTSGNFSLQVACAV